MKSFITPVIVAVVVGALCFFGGMQYQQSKQPNRQQMGMNRPGGSDRTNNRAGTARGMQGGRPVTGEITNYDSNTITVKMPDGSTKIVIVSDTTKVFNSVSVSKDQLTVGETVTVMGTQDEKQTMTANTIMLGETMLTNQPSGQPAEPTNQPEGN